MKIAQVLNADSWGEIGPEALQRGIGGREGALIRLSKEWAKLGHEVTNFVPTKKGHKFSEKSRVIPAGVCVDGDPYGYGFHEYIPFGLAKPMLRCFDYDAVIAWECPSIFDHEDILERQKVRLVHMQVAHLGGEVEPAEKFATGIVALSPWARDFLLSDGLEFPAEKMFVRPNGVDLSAYPEERIRPRIEDYGMF